MRNANIVAIEKSSNFLYYKAKKKRNIRICFYMRCFANYDNGSCP